VITQYAIHVLFSPRSGELRTLWCGRLNLTTRVPLISNRAFVGKDSEPHFTFSASCGSRGSRVWLELIRGSSWKKFLPLLSNPSPHNLHCNLGPPIPSTMVRQNLRAAATALPSLLTRVALEPIFTGPLLLALLRGRLSLHAQLLYPLDGQPCISVSTVLTTLKWLFGLGLARKVNAVLTAYAHNHWHVRKMGEPWDFDEDGKKEIAVVTGGCSGFGLLIAKGLSKNMRVVVLDVQDAPKEFENCVFPHLRWHLASRLLNSSLTPPQTPQSPTTTAT
jgi:hypothetical protein